MTDLSCLPSQTCAVRCLVARKLLRDIHLLPIESGTNSQRDSSQIYRALGRWVPGGRRFSNLPMRLGVILKFRVATFAVHALRTGAHLHAVCMHFSLQNGAILCKIMQNCMVTDRMKTSG